MIGEEKVSMRGRSFRSDMAYLGGLVGAGLDGIASARLERNSPAFARPPLVFAPTALGAAVGALGTRLLGKRKSSSNVVMGGLVGSMVGCGAAVAWASRGSVLPAFRGAIREVSAVRDARWLEINPIDYA
jgi:hypothetical protein